MKKSTPKTPHRRSTYRPEVAAVAGLTHAVADLVEALEAALAEWQRKARMAKYHAEKTAAAGKK